MSDIELDIAFWQYDRTRVLVDGTVTISGVQARFHTAPIVMQIFEESCAGSSRLRNSASRIFYECSGARLALCSHPGISEPRLSPLYHLCQPG